MLDINLTCNYGYHWFSDKNTHVKGIALYEGELLQGEKFLAYFNDVKSEAVFKKKLQNLNGLFSVVLLNENELMIGVDKIRNFPLLYTYKKEELKISDSYKTFLGKNSSFDEDSKIDMQLVGWVPGKKTLIKDVFQLQAGQYLIYNQDEDLLKTKFWHRPDVSDSIQSERENCKAALRDSFDKIGENLIKAISGRPVMLPLSGGFDSRLIALLLKKKGYKNVQCFTYGNPDNKEAINSKEIAHRLNFPWMIIDYKPYIKDDFTATETYKKYMEYAGNAMSFPYIQEYFSAMYLKEKQLIPENAVFIPGHSGDTIAGAHIFPDIKNITSPENYAKKVARTYGRLINHGKDDEKHLLNTLKSELFSSTEANYYTYENWQIKEHQTKQMVNSAKVWDFIGFEYLLPLSDNVFMDFFSSIPFEYRVFKNLYDETLMELYAENGILLDDEVTYSQNKRKKDFFLVKLRTYIPFSSQLKRIKRPESFFYFSDFTSAMESKFSQKKYKTNNGLLTAYYINELEKSLRKL